MKTQFGACGPVSHSRGLAQTSSKIEVERRFEWGHAWCCEALWTVLSGRQSCRIAHRAMDRTDTARTDSGQYLVTRKAKMTLERRGAKPAGGASLQCETRLSCWLTIPRYARVPRGNRRDVDWYRLRCSLRESHDALECGVDRELGKIGKRLFSQKQYSDTLVCLVCEPIFGLAEAVVNSTC